MRWLPQGPLATKRPDANERSIRHPPQPRQGCPDCVRVFALKGARQGIGGGNKRRQADLFRQVTKYSKSAVNLQVAALLVASLNEGRKIGKANKILDNPPVCLLASQPSIKCRQFLAIRIKPVGNPKGRNCRMGGGARCVERTMLHGPLLAGHGLQGISAGAIYLSKFWKMLPI
jgi:hypothetical protein